jgi:hypothetical protein
MIDFYGNSRDWNLQGHFQIYTSIFPETPDLLFYERNEKVRKRGIY